MFVNYMAREISAFIVFIGPPGSGRRTVMGDFHHLSEPRGKVQWTEAGLEALASGAVWFDFLPPKLGTLDGRTVRVHFEMPPDALGFPEMFEAAVKRADAIVFVADSRRAVMPENLAVIRALDRSIDRTTVPVVFFLNKRDLPDLVPIGELASALAVNGAPPFEGDATKEGGVAAVKAAVKAAILRHQGKPFW
jgi:signal recognition particle receptor subunit beta